MSSPFVVCCLGNPGPRYDGTRHNLGFALGDVLVTRAAGRWSRPCDEYLQSHVRISGHDVIVLKPQTYMNLSGRALSVLARTGAEPVAASRTLVVCDDIALPLGLLRLRKHGSDGGHNGLRSIIDSLGTTRFPCLRLGVGLVPSGVDAADFVLEPMTADEAADSAKLLREAVKCVETILGQGLDVAMNRFNRRAQPPTEQAEE